MAMNKTLLGTAIDTAVKAVVSAPESPTHGQDVWQAVADEIIKHLKNNMEITVPPGDTNVGIAIAPGAVVSQGSNLGQTIGPGSNIS